MSRQLSPLQRRFRIALLARDLAVEDIAREVGIAPTSLRNIINGSVVSDDTRQRMPNAMRERLEDDVPVIHYHTFQEGTEIEFETERLAEEFAAQFADSVKRNGSSITFLGHTRAAITCVPERHRIRKRPEVASAS